MRLQLPIADYVSRIIYNFVDVLKSPFVLPIVNK